MVQGTQAVSENLVQVLLDLEALNREHRNGKGLTLIICPKDRDLPVRSLRVPPHAHSQTPSDTPWMNRISLISCYHWRV